MKNLSVLNETVFNMKDILKLNIPWVTPLTKNDKKLYDDFFKSEWAKSPFTYGNSWTYICQAARYNPYKYYDGKSLITISNIGKDNNSFQIIRPVGKNLSSKIENICINLRELTNKPIIIKKVERNEYNDLKSRGFNDPNWNLNVLRDLPDDIYPQPICKLENYFKNNQISLEGSSFLKLRQKIKRFEKHKIDWQLEKLSLKNINNVKEVITEWKNVFIKRYQQKNIILPKNDSYYIDPYIIFLRNVENNLNNNEDISLVFYVNEIPSGFSYMGIISNIAVAQYANITINHFKGMAEFFTLMSFYEAFKRGFKYVNMGGSETESLFKYNQKYAPIRYLKDYYLLYLT